MEYKKRKNECSKMFDQREKDFRNGSIVYQILVDRFAPSEDLEAKANLYKEPKILKQWNEVPKAGSFNEEAQYWQHELEYWGGDLKSLKSKLDYIKDLNIDIVYLNPIPDSLSNHKYDATDYMKISEEYGTMEDLKALSDTLHQKGMKIILDGVFNHVGINNTIFKEAKNPKSKYRSWFDFNDAYPKGVRLWYDVPSLPEWNLENEDVRNYIYKDKDSVIRSYLRNGIDGWRLDVAFDIGYEFLEELTYYAHLEKPGSMIVGETWNYPKEWLKSMDGVMNFTFRELIKKLLDDSISPKLAMLYFKQIIDDAGIEAILKSWVLLDNHDTDRLSNQITHIKKRKLAQVLQFTLPGSPNLYYGTELGMTGGMEPESRAPMRWDLVTEANKTLQWTKELISLHQNNRALRIGNFDVIYTEKLIAFLRTTDRVEDTCIVILNTTNDTVKEDMLVPDSSLMNASSFDVVFGEALVNGFIAGFLSVSLKPNSFVVLKPHTIADKSYTSYKRV
jgi:glycosidase